MHFPSSPPLYGALPRPSQTDQSPRPRNRSTIVSCAVLSISAFAFWVVFAKKRIEKVRKPSGKVREDWPLLYSQCLDWDPEQCQSKVFTVNKNALSANRFANQPTTRPVLPPTDVDGCEQVYKTMCDTVAGVVTTAVRNVTDNVASGLSEGAVDNIGDRLSDKDRNVTQAAAQNAVTSIIQSANHFNATASATDAANKSVKKNFPIVLKEVMEGLAGVAGTVGNVWLISDVIHVTGQIVEKVATREAEKAAEKEIRKFMQPLNKVANAAAEKTAAGLLVAEEAAVIEGGVAAGSEGVVEGGTSLGVDGAVQEGGALATGAGESGAMTAAEEEALAAARAQAAAQAAAAAAEAESEAAANFWKGILLDLLEARRSLLKPSVAKDEVPDINSI